MEKILIKNCAVLPMTGRSDYIEKGSICIELGRIKAVQAGEMTDPGWEPDRVIDGSGCVAIPGMVNCHTHAAMT